MAIKILLPYSTYCSEINARKCLEEKGLLKSSSILFTLKDLGEKINAEIKTGCRVV